MKKNKIIETMLLVIFGRTNSTGIIPNPATEFIIIETYAGKIELKDIYADLICSAYRRQTAAKSG